MRVNSYKRHRETREGDRLGRFAVHKITYWVTKSIMKNERTEGEKRSRRTGAEKDRKREKKECIKT